MPIRENIIDEGRIECIAFFDKKIIKISPNGVILLTSHSVFNNLNKK